MNLQQLETFREVVELSSFTKAASRLHTTQSTISMRVSELEQELGVQLLDRSRRQLQVTPKGRELLKYAVKMCQLRQEIFADVGQSERFSASIRLGVAELVALSWLPELVTQVNDVYPNVELTFEVGLSGDCYKKVVNRDCDLLFATTDGTYIDGLVYEPLYEIDFRYMCSPSLNLHQKPLTPECLEKCCLISLGQTSALANIEDRWMRQNQVRPKKVYRSNSMAVSAGLAKTGLGIAFLPVDQYSRDLADGSLKALEITPRMPKVQFSAVYSDSDLAPQTSIMLKFARKLLKNKGPFPH